MKKNIYSLLFILFGFSVTSGQVTIGVSDPSHEGALLDMSKPTTPKRGLLFPKVPLIDVKIFQLPGDGDPDKEAAGAGMVVYNTNKNTIGGDGVWLYVWDREDPTNPNSTLVWRPWRKGGLPKVAINPVVLVDCGEEGGVKIILTRPAIGWTDAEWDLLSPANVSVTINGDPITGTWKKESATTYSYTIINPSNVSQTATITVNGLIGTKTVAPETVSVNVPVNSAVDYEGNVYSAKQFGTQCWMTQNLRSVLDNEGIPIDPNNGSVDKPYITMNPGIGNNGSSVASGNTVIIIKWESDNNNKKKIKYDDGNLPSSSYSVPGYYENGNLITYSANTAGYNLFANKFGFLYTNEAVDNSNLCPEGWKVPSVADVNVLSGHLGGTAADGGAGKRIRELIILRISP